MKLTEEKKQAFESIKETIKDVINDDTFLTHDMLIVLIHEAKQLIKSDF